MERALQNEWATGVQSEARTPLRDRVMKNKHSAPSPALPRQIEAHYRGQSTGWPVILGGISRERLQERGHCAHGKKAPKLERSKTGKTGNRRWMELENVNRSFETPIFFEKNHVAEVEMEYKILVEDENLGLSNG